MKNEKTENSAAYHQAPIVNCQLSIVNCFIPFAGTAQAEKTVKGLQESGLVNNIYLMAMPDVTEKLPGCRVLHTDSILSSGNIRNIAGHADAKYTLIYTKYTTLELGCLPWNV